MTPENQQQSAAAPISSQSNERLKRARALLAGNFRAHGELFAAEGEDLIAAAALVGWQPVDLFCEAGSSLPGTPVLPQVLATVSALRQGSRQIGVYDKRYIKPAEVGDLCVFLDGVSDPGNVGTIVRAAHAFGASSVAVGERSADPFTPRAVRASMGSVFALPVTKCDLTELSSVKVALVAHGGDASLPTARPLVVVIGAEREGVSTTAEKLCDYAWTVPLKTESLNAAMAATVALYELARGTTSPAVQDVAPESNIGSEAT